jgi:DNA-binding transcriptional ArsR family regulator
MDIKTFSHTMKALSEPNRIKIIKALEGGPLCVCELTKLLALSQPTASKHAKVLEQAGLIVGTRRGAWVWYERMEGMKILQLLDDVLQKDTESESLLEQAQQLRSSRKEEQLPFFRNCKGNCSALCTCKEAELSSSL